MGKKTSSKVKTTCQQCGKEFEIWPCRIRAGRDKFCSKVCEGRWRSEHIRGKNHHAYNRVPRTCEQCGKTFEVAPNVVERGGGRFCSRDCQNRRRSENLIGEKSANWKGGDARVVCSQCGIEFDVPRRNVKTDRGNFCSKDCYVQWQAENVPSGKDSPYWERVTCSCEVCGKEFEKKPSVIADGKGRFCSKECYSIWESKSFQGSSNPNWRGGKSFEPYSPEFNKRLKSYIRKRDNHKCALCSKRAKSVHHIDYCKENCDPENLITICRKCHGKTNANRRFWRTILAPVARRREAA